MLFYSRLFEGDYKLKKLNLIVVFSMLILTNNIAYAAKHGEVRINEEELSLPEYHTPVTEITVKDKIEALKLKKSEDGFYDLIEPSLPFTLSPLIYVIAPDKPLCYVLGMAGIAGYALGIIPPITTFSQTLNVFEKKRNKGWI